jgi:hypothetical protein
MLSKSTLPFCVIRHPIDQLRLSSDFMYDLAELLQEENVHVRSHQAIAECILNGAYTRENFGRRINRIEAGDAPELINSITSFSIVCALLLRPRYPLPVTATKRLDLKDKFYPDYIREDILELLWRYGVKCARGECCGVLKKPKEKHCEHTIAS